MTSRFGIGMRVGAAVGAAALTLGLAAACGNGEDGSGGGESAQGDDAIVLYSGRSEDLVDPLIDQLEEKTGLTIDVRYGSTPELAAQLAEEGDATPADLFLSQDAGALGALERAGALATLPDAAVDLVDETYRAADDTWVATSLRARVIQYDSEEVDEADVPRTIDEVLDPKWRGKVGYAPSNASFQSFVTALRVDRGDEAAEQWLRDFEANEPVKYERNGPLLEGVDNGEVALGLSNHYYWYNKAKEVGADNMRAKVMYLEPGDPGALVNVAGVAVLGSSDKQEQAFQVVEALLSPESQEYFVEETSEYPVIDGVDTAGTDLPDIETLSGPDIDLADLESLEDTQAMLQRVGMI